MPAWVNWSLKFLVPGPSAEPIPRNNTFTFLLNAAVSANAPLQLVFASNAPPHPSQLPLNPPIQVNLSRLDSVVRKLCIPPMESPAMARFSRPGSTRYVLSIVGIRSVSIISVKVTPVKLASPPPGGPGALPGPGGAGSVRGAGASPRPAKIDPPSPGFTAFRLSMTAIIGFAAPAAMGLSMMKSTWPCLVGLGKFDSAVEPSGSEEGHRRWISDRRSVYPETVVVEANHERRRGHGPDSVRTLRHIETAPHSDRHRLGVRRNHTEHRAMVRIHAPILCRRRI